MDLAEFLAARLDEDEAGATGCINCGQPIRRATTTTGFTHGDKSAVGGGWQGIRCAGKVTGALPWPDPARALREVEAGRKLIAEIVPWMDGCEDEHWYSRGVGTQPPYEGSLLLLRILASVFSDHPDYDPAWAVVS